jgi:hypothetical protein
MKQEYFWALIGVLIIVVGGIYFYSAASRKGGGAAAPSVGVTQYLKVEGTALAEVSQP